MTDFETEKLNLELVKRLQIIYEGNLTQFKEGRENIDSKFFKDVDVYYINTDELNSFLGDDDLVSGDGNIQTFSLDNGFWYDEGSGEELGSAEPISEAEKPLSFEVRKAYENWLWAKKNQHLWTHSTSASLISNHIFHALKLVIYEEGLDEKTTLERLEKLQ